MVKICVGESRKAFFLHRKLLCELDYFKAALEGHFREAESGELSFPEHGENTFSLFVSWIYDTSPYRHIFNEEAPEELILLLGLAEQLTLEPMYNDTMDALRILLKVELAESLHHESKYLACAYKCSAGAKARFLLCLLFMAQVTQITYDQVPDDMHDLFQQGGQSATDLLRLFLLRLGKSPANLSTELLERKYDCLFHNHRSGSFCYIKPSKYNKYNKSAWETMEKVWTALENTSELAPRLEEC